MLNINGANGLRLLRSKVGDISRNLLAAQDLLDMGHAIHLDNAGCYMEHKETGVRTPIEQRNRVFEMDLQVALYDPFVGRARPQ